MVDSINTEDAGFPHFTTIHDGVGHFAFFPINTFSPCLIREGRLKYWRIGSLGAHLLQEHVFTHLTNINQVPLGARPWAGSQGSSRNPGRHTLSSLELSPARETKVLMSVL